MIFWCVVFFIFGLLFGSFFNVLIYRLPKKLSVVSPPSSCPHCEHQIRWYENIPLFSYLLLLKGKCRGCSKSISIQYPLIELITGILSLTIGYVFLTQGKFPSVWWEYVPLLVQYLTLILLVPVIIIDCRHKIIPNKITFTGVVSAIIISFFPGGISPQEMILGILAGGGILLAISLIGTAVLRRRSLGMGDVKLMAWFGAFFGWQIALGTIFIGSIVGIIFGIGYQIFQREKDSKIPFGPALSVALIITILFGSDIWNSYLTLYN